VSWQSAFSQTESGPLDVAAVLHHTLWAKKQRVFAKAKSREASPCVVHGLSICAHIVEARRLRELAGAQDMFTEKGGRFDKLSLCHGVKMRITPDVRHEGRKKCKGRKWKALNQTVQA